MSRSTPVEAPARPAHAEDQPAGPAPMIVGIAVSLTLLLMLILTAFAYPATNAAPNNVPVAIVGPDRAVQQISAGLEQQAGQDGFAVIPLGDREGAIEAIESREAYGAIVLGPNGGEMLIATAASPAVAQILTGIAAGIPAEAGGPLAVKDIVPLPKADPRGAALGSSLLPLVIGGIASGAVIALRVPGLGAQLLAAIATAVGAGAGMTLILSIWLDALPGTFWAIAGTLALAIIAVSVFIIGLCRLIGPVGIGVAALIVMLFGNPFSGATSAAELLPAGWGAVGQFLPPGASTSLLRSTGYFDGAGSGMPIGVLVGWVAVGVVLAVVGSRRSASNGAA